MNIVWTDELVYLVRLIVAGICGLAIGVERKNRAKEAGLPYLKAGVPMKEFVIAVKNVFRDAGLAEYDVYPPLHGIGCAEAESPYPNEGTEAVFTAGMCVNTDISLFGLAGGSNRIEEGFIITEEGADTICPFMREYYENWLKGI